MRAGQLVDLDRYPILSRETERYRELVAHCRAQLGASGACELPGFITAGGTAALAREAEELAPIAYHSAVTGNAYLEPIDPSLPDDHPKRQIETTALAVVAYDQFPRTSALRQLYEWDPLTELLADCLGAERLYRYADPMGALNLAVMRKGDYLRWHFDQTDFVTSIAIQSSERGGDFEFVPNIRARDDERYDRVARVLAGDRSEVQTIPMVPGTLLLFEGRRSIHRVTTIEGRTLRHVGLLGYDTRPGVNSSDHLRRMRYGRTVPYPPS